jgi:hypothetical protein
LLENDSFMAHLSVVVPVYKAEKCLEEVYERFSVSLESLTEDYEIILVEDCRGGANLGSYLRVDATRAAGEGDSV